MSRQVNTAREVERFGDLNKSFVPSPRFEGKIVTSHRTQNTQPDQTSIFVDFHLPKNIQTHDSIFTKFNGIGM